MPRPPVNSEVRTLDGLNYYRYPDSPHWSKRAYFNRPFDSYHRALWRKAHGEIPPGYEIHHADHDTLNNALDNLVLTPISEHRSESQAYRRLHHYVCAWCGADF